MAFIEPHDFERLGESPEVINQINSLKEHRPRCPECGFELTARVATFSYSKAFDYFQFRASWEAALRYLINARNWLFIGYSLPEADFELRQMLKTAQLASERDQPKNICVVLKDDDVAADRYYRFFGIGKAALCNAGFEQWVTDDRPKC